MSALASPLLGIVALTMAGCSATPVSAIPPQAGTVSQQMVLTWFQDLPPEGGARSALEAELSRIARVPVRLAATVSHRTAAVVFACPSGPACADAERRLRAHAQVIELEPDGRRRIHGAGLLAPNPQ
ncbi:MAG: hypothetical protein ABI564_11170 [Ideonella sp.]